MKKLCMLLFALVLLLTGCCQTQITCGVDRDKNAYLSFEVIASWEDAPEQDAPHLKYGFEQIVQHYQYRLGFEPEIEEYTDTGCHLKLTRSRPGETYEDAFRELEAMLTKDTMTPFMEVHTKALREGAVEGYGAELTVDAGRFTQAMEIEDMARELRGYFGSGLKESTATLTLELPATEVLEASGNAVYENGTAKVTVPIDLSGITNLSLSTLAVTENGALAPNTQKDLADSLSQKEQELHTWLMAAGGAAGVLVLSLLTILFLRIRKARKIKAEKMRQLAREAAALREAEAILETRTTVEAETPMEAETAVEADTIRETEEPRETEAGGGASPEEPVPQFQEETRKSVPLEQKTEG